MIQEYLNYLRYELNRAELTIGAYERDLRQFSAWITTSETEEPDFKSVTSSDVRAWLSSLAKQGESPRTLRRKTIALRTFYKWLKKRGEIERSPVDSLALPKLSKPLPDLIRAEEVEEILGGATSKETREDYSGTTIEPKGKGPSRTVKKNWERETLLRETIVEILYTLGIRRAELAGLNDEDISFTKGEIKVTGKRSKQRIVPVPLKLLNKIKAWQEWRDREEEKPEGETPLLVTKGKRITEEKLYRVVKGALAETTARKKSPHALRHTFASGMLNGGADIDSVKEFLGHASLATTQIYTHISLKEIKKAYGKAHPRVRKEN